VDCNYLIISLLWHNVLLYQQVRSIVKYYDTHINRKTPAKVGVQQDRRFPMYGAVDRQTSEASRNQPQDRAHLPPKGGFSEILELQMLRVGGQVS
jgi:hypothetical protein